MAAREQGLGLWYRFTWRIRYTLLSVFGPAELGDDDPRVRLRRERLARVAARRPGE